MGMSGHDMPMDITFVPTPFEGLLSGLLDGWSMVADLHSDICQSSAR